MQAPLPPLPAAARRTLRQLNRRQCLARLLREQTPRVPARLEVALNSESQTGCAQRERRASVHSAEASPTKYYLLKLKY